MAELYWKLKYNALEAKLQELSETARWDKEAQPAHCISTADEFFVSHSLEIVDNEEYALEHWGEGFYFKVRKVES